MTWVDIDQDHLRTGTAIYALAPLMSISSDFLFKFWTMYFRHGI